MVFIVAIFLACSQSPEARAKMILHNGLEDSSPMVRISAARGLSMVGDTNGKETLREMLANNDPIVQARALEALIGDIRGMADLSSLPSDLFKSTNASVREAAYQIVAAMDDTSAKRMLIQGTNDGSGKVRAIAFMGLGKYRENDLLQSGLHDTDPLVRIAAAQTLGELGIDGMAEFVEGELRKLTPNTLGVGIIALARLSDSTALPLLRALLRESSGELRVDIAEALFMLHDTLAVEVLKGAIRSNDPFVRMHAVEVLKRHNVPDLYDELVVAAHDEYKNVAVEAVGALAERDGMNQKELFVELMGSQNSLLRLAAAAAYLGSVDGP